MSQVKSITLYIYIYIYIYDYTRVIICHFSKSGDTVVSRVSSISSDIETYTTLEKLPCIFTRAGEMRASEIFVYKKRLNRSNSK